MVDILYALNVHKEQLHLTSLDGAHGRIRARQIIYLYLA